MNITEYEQMGGGAKISWAQGRKVPKYGPNYSTSSLKRINQGP